jgi:hypothetical protein
MRVTSDSACPLQDLLLVGFMTLNPKVTFCACEERSIPEDGINDEDVSED